MPKLLLEAHELTDADVDFVSLVKRGANRIPFRIVKEDTSDMLDLHKIGRKLFKQAAGHSHRFSFVEGVLDAQAAA
jgi:hypothetical protein